MSGNPAIQQGDTFGRLTAIGFLGERTKQGTRLIYCRCECGQVVKIQSTNLASGSTVSCGCARRERAALLTFTHGFCAPIIPEYRIWDAMVRRCTTPTHHAWKDYGGRGITVCDEWHKSFPSFLAHIGFRPDPSLTLDRIENDGNYEPGNVRWATRSVQQSNQRRQKRKVLA